MRDTFRHTAALSHIATRFTEKARAERRFGWAVDSVVTHRAGNDYRVGPNHIRATGAALGRLRHDLLAVLQLAELANLYDKRIAPETWEVIRRSASGLSGDLAPEARARFLLLLNHPARLGELLRGLHEVGLLEIFIPAFAHARGLLQFNQYHKYTVDEHCLRAVEQATELLSDTGPLGDAYRDLTRKALLHLALLIHDLGKGYPEDHCEVGLRIADAAAKRLALSPGDADTLKFLVHGHLSMNHLALRRDIDDESLVVRFAADVGSPERLQMLYVMTACDLRAVAPDTWTGWKGEVLAGLYHRTMRALTGKAPTTSFAAGRHSRREGVLAKLGQRRDDSGLAGLLDSLPDDYLDGTTPEQIADDLRLFELLEPRQVIARGSYLPENETVQFTVVTSEDMTPGVFHRLTGALTAAGLRILTAQINTFGEGLVLDRFWAHDPDFAGGPPPERLAQIETALRDALLAPEAKTPSFRRTWKSDRAEVLPSDERRTRVEIDNTSSREYTILDIFATDRPGLLYAVSRTLFELRLSLRRAKISTHLDQVVDVFYVTDVQGGKVEDASRLDKIHETLLQAIDSHQSP